ncbi:MAG: MerR family transcriptional regulator [Chitinophagaceae bacterium]
MGQLSLFDAFGSEPNPVPKPPRPPKRAEKDMLEKTTENKPENKSEINAESKPETPSFVIETPIESPSFIIESPIETPQVSVPTNPTPGSGFYYEPPLYQAPVLGTVKPSRNVFEIVQPLAESTEAPTLVVEEEKDIASTPMEIELPQENEVSVTEEEPMLEYTEEEHIQVGVTAENQVAEVIEAAPEPIIEPISWPIEEPSSPKIAKTNSSPKPKTKAVPTLNESVQEEVPSVIDIASLTKQYYSISEVAKLFGVNASHLRYWEKEFPTQLGNVRKNGKGDRFYTPKNIEQLQVIFHLVRNKKMTLEGARKQLKLKKKSLKTEADAYDLMQQVRRFLVDLKSQLD